MAVRKAKKEFDEFGMFWMPFSILVIYNHWTKMNHNVFCKCSVSSRNLKYYLSL